MSGEGEVVEVVIDDAITDGEEETVNLSVNEVTSVEEGGLNIYKFRTPEAEKETGWATGDRFMHLPDQGSPKLNWAQNKARLLKEMKAGNPIYDSYRNTNGVLKDAKGGFLQKERNLLKFRGWKYNPSKGAWISPK